MDNIDASVLRAVFDLLANHYPERSVPVSALTSVSPDTLSERMLGFSCISVSKCPGRHVDRTLEARKMLIG